MTRHQGTRILVVLTVAILVPTCSSSDTNKHTSAKSSNPTASSSHTVRQRAETSTVSGTPSTAPPRRLILESNPGRSATGLRAKTTCTTNPIGRSVASLTWRPASTPGESQVVEVTIYSFDSGQTDASPLLAPDADHYALDEISGQATHYWRVLTRHGDRWIPSSAATFVGPTCTVDVQP